MIKIDMEMPIYCYDCPCHNGENGRCQISGDFTVDKRPFDCPLTKDEPPIDAQEAKDAINRQPTVEAEPIKHGWWIEERFKLVNFYCSICDHYSPDGEKHNFCPNCGAKMDGKEKEK